MEKSLTEDFRRSYNSPQISSYPTCCSFPVAIGPATWRRFVRSEQHPASKNNQVSNDAPPVRRKPEWKQKEFRIYMKRSLLAIAALATTFAVGAMAQTNEPPSAPSPASATEAPPTGVTKLAVIAFQPAVASTNEGRQALAKVQQKFEPKQTELKGLSDEIDTLKKQLQSSGSTLSQDARAAQLRTIDDKEKSLQRQAQDAQTDYQQAMSEAFQGIAQKFYAVMQDYAQSNGYGLVLDMSSQQTPVVWASKGADITAAVVKEYNQKSGIAAPAAQPSTGSTGGAAHSTTTHHRTTTSH
jgi:outer membrane protein